MRVLEAALRGVAARLAVENATDNELDELAAVHAEALRVARSRQSRGAVVTRVVELTRRFHSMLDACSHNPVIVKMIATTMAFDYVARADRIKRLGKDYPTAWVDEHAEIIDALRARDADRAEQLIRAHVLHTGRYLASAADEK
jgi:DNA-binding GntR family transcriptional regulator